MALAPTSKQLAYLKALALRNGTSFVAPRTRAEASRQIDLMRCQDAVDRRRTEHESAMRPRRPFEPRSDETVVSNPDMPSSSRRYGTPVRRVDSVLREVLERAAERQGLTLDDFQFPPIESESDAWAALHIILSGQH